MADDKNKKQKNKNSMDKLTLSLKSTNINTKKAGSSNTTTTAYSLDLSNKNGNLVLSIQATSSQSQRDSHRQTKPITAGPKTNPQASKSQPNLNTAQKNTTNPSKTHPNLNSGRKSSPHIPKTQPNLNSGHQKAQSPSKTHPKVNIGQKRFPDQSNSNNNPNSNTVPKKSSYAPKAHPNFSNVQKHSPGAFKSHSNTNVETKSFKTQPNITPKNSIQAFTTHASMSAGHVNNRPDNTNRPNWATRDDSFPAAVKMHPNFNNFAQNNSLAHLRGSWDCGLDGDQYQIKDGLLHGKGYRPHHNTNENEFNCPTCKATFLLQIYQCASGHSSCSNCKEQGCTCGICGQVITDMRNFALEGYLADKKLPCPHSIDGCKLVIKMTEMENHVKECPFGILDCPAGCSYKMPVKQLSGHFDDQHPGQRLAGVGSEVELRHIYEPSEKMYLLQIGAFHFLFHEWVSPQDRRIYMAAQLIGTKISASKWFYEVHIYAKNEPHREYTFSEICTSFVEPVVDVFNEGKCCILTQKHAVTFLHSAAVHYKVFIKKIVENKPQEEF